jgi:hypothetical protein
MSVATKKEERQEREILTSINPDREHFNFEIWAKMVRHQMLAVLQKK